MSVNYTTLGNRVGAAVFLLNLVNKFRGGTYPTTMSPNLSSRWTSFVATYDGDTPAIRATISDSTAQLNSGINGLSAVSSWVSSALTKTLIEMMYDAHPLTAKTISASMAELITEMLADAQSVKANTVTISATAGGSNVGNGKVITSLLDGNGKTLEYCYAETLPLVFTSTFSAGAERASISGTVAATSMTGQDWPLGSAGSASVVSMDAAATNNFLTNGGFDTFTVSNVADNWTYDVGTAGSQFFSEASVIFKGKALKVAGDGSTQSGWSQPLSVSALNSDTPYALNFWCKNSANPAAGVLTVDLYDGTSVIADQSAANNSFTVDLTTLGTSYVAKNHVFRFKEPLPATAKLRFRFTTAMSSAKSFYIDQVTFQPMTQLYTAGPFVALASGNANWSLDDTYSIVVGNDYGGQVQTAFWRCFNMPTLGMILPSVTDSSETIPNSIIA